MKKFELPEFEAGKTFLEYLLDPKKLAETLGRLQALVDEINGKVEAVGTIEQIEAMKTQIVAKLAEANEIRRQAEDIRRQGEAVITKANEEAKAIVLKAMTDADTIKRQAGQLQDKANEQAKAVAELAAQWVKREKLAEQKMTDALALAQEAEETKQKYERKLQAFQEAVKA